ncbi:MAG TPA: histidine kinase [Pyrinomonadaceae bacterium]
MAEQFNKARFKAAAIILFWTILGLSFALQAYLANTYFQRHPSWWRTVSVWLIWSCGWAMLTPPVFWLARRYPLERGKILRSLLVHVLAGTIYSLLSLIIYLVVWLQINETVWNLTFQRFQFLFVSEFHTCLLIYLIIVGLTHAYEYYSRYRERELAAFHLQTKLAQAELDILKMQLHPHFLFNTLNTISVLMNKDVKAANRMLGNLSDLLRAALKNAHTNEVPLRQELEFLNCYLEIEQARFSDRLKVSRSIDPLALDASVPSLILQPLVENAIRHGIAPRVDTGHVEILARRINGSVELTIRDDGPGLMEGFQSDTAQHIGLSNTRARLAQLYGSDHRFELNNSPEGGAVATICIPFRRFKNSSERKLSSEIPDTNRG